MELDEIIASFALLSGDAIGIGYRGPDDKSARLVWVNDAFLDTFRWPDDHSWKGQAVEVLNEPDCLEEFVDLVKPRFLAGERTFSAETMCRRADGSRFWASINLVSLPLDKAGGRYSAAVYRDLTALHAREAEALAAIEERDTLLADSTEAETRLISAINAMPDPIAIWDENFRLVICNDAFAPRLLGKDKQIPRGASVEDVLYEAAYSGQFVDALGNEDEWWKGSVNALRSGPIRDRTRYTDGRIFRANSHLAPNGDSIVITMDVTELEAHRLELERANDEIQHIAFHDDLTGIANRRGFSAAMDALVKTPDMPAALVQVDLDHFKSINDSMGHGAGDEVLRETARRLKETADGDALVARIGGDEFAVLLRGDEAVAQVDILASELVTALTRPVTYRGGAIRTGASIGIARTPVSSLEDLLTDVDIALYKAKSQGRARAAVFDATDREALRAEQALADDILRGIEAQEFVPVFQPQVCSATGFAVGAEILARWNHPERGLLPPQIFLRPAEALNVLELIDRQVFERAMRIAIEAFDPAFAPALAFNVGRQRVMSPAIAEATALARSYPGEVAFELLETIFFDEEAEAFLLSIDAIKDAGVSIEIDDFGSGRASLIALQKIAPDRLKIDRQLIHPIVRSDESRRLVQSIIEMGRALRIGVTAEGVETEDHARILTDLGCDRLQGYYFSPPESMDKLFDRFWGSKQPVTQLARSQEANAP